MTETNDRKNQTEKSINYHLNSIKGIACLGVVPIHIKFPEIIGEIFWVLGQFAVPLFFMISGYYMPERQNKFEDIKIKRKAFHIGKITICSIFIYWLYFCIRGGVKQLKWNNKILIKLLVLQDLDFLNAGHLWFLLSLLYIYILCYIVLKRKRNRTNKIYFLIPLLFLIRIIIPAFSGYNWHWRGNFLITGVPYFLTGRFIADHKIIFLKIKIKSLYAALVLGFVFAVFQVFVPYRINIYDSGIILSSIAIFFIAQKAPDNSISFFEKLGEKHSLYIYIMHILMADLTEKAAHILAVQDLMFYLWTKPMIVIIITIISNLIFCNIRNKIAEIIKR